MNDPSHRRPYRRAWVLGCVAAAAGLLPAVVSAEEAPDISVEAADLYRFAPFVTWPGGGGPFTICVVGDDPFGEQLEHAVAGQTLDGRLVQVRRIETIGPKSDCAIAYLGGSPGESVAEALRAVRGEPVLTVTADNDPPGIIAFAVTDGQVGFRVDDVQARENGLVISSKLLDLAVAVRAAPGQGEP